MGEMASGLAHELNQPLCAIVNFTEACVEFVRRNGHDRARLCLTLGEVTRQAERAGEVIRRLRDFVRRREPQRRAADINAIIQDVLAFTGVEVRHSEVRVRFKPGWRLPRVFADAIQIEQVLVNLVRNACEAMREGGKNAKVLTLETKRRRGAVEVSVKDSGPGISDERKERLFEPFFTTKRNGMGMGLSITRSILEVHEGRLWVTSNRKGGTTFHFTLPTAWRVRHDQQQRIRRR
jgi:C4-dicarboxylate-specific signal transduction histidine kinase